MHRQTDALALLVAAPSAGCYLYCLLRFPGSFIAASGGFLLLHNHDCTCTSSNINDPPAKLLPYIHITFKIDIILMTKDCFWIIIPLNSFILLHLILTVNNLKMIRFFFWFFCTICVSCECRSGNLSHSNPHKLTSVDYRDFSGAEHICTLFESN